MSSKARIYNYADWLRMKPGTIIHGCMKTGVAEAQLGSAWGGRSTEVGMEFNIRVVLEHEVRWRERLTGTTVNQVKVYQTERLSPLPAEDTTTLRLPIGQPVGIFLGHIVRAPAVSYVNVLAGEGIDVWFVSRL